MCSRPQPFRILPVLAFCLDLVQKSQLVGYCVNEFSIHFDVGGVKRRRHFRVLPSDPDLRRLLDDFD